MHILAIDPATLCGWAAWDDVEVCSGVWNLKPGRGETPGVRFLRFEACLRLAMMEPPRIVAWEQSHQQGNASAVYNGLKAIMQKQVAKWVRCHDVDVLTCNNTTLKKWSTGSGRASKEDMIQAAMARYCEYTLHLLDDNEADALLLLAWAREQVGE